METAVMCTSRARNLRHNDPNTSSSPRLVEPTHALTITLRIVRIMTPERSSTNFHGRRTPPTLADGDEGVQYGGGGCGNLVQVATRAVRAQRETRRAGSLPLRSEVSSFPLDRCRRSVCGGHTLRRTSEV